MTPAAGTAEPQTIELMGLRLHALTEAQCVHRLFDAMEQGRGGFVVTPNLDHLRRHTRSAEFRALCAEADLSVADGMPLVWASRLQRTPLPERVAGSNLITSLSAEAARRGRRVYLLGGDLGTAAAAARVLCERFPGLAIAGTDCPGLGFEQDPDELSGVGDAIRAARPDLVLVALGSPKQEVVIGALRSQLPAAWWIGVGISFSFVAGAVHRAPQWMQRLGIEWVHRLVQEPRRLARRYLVDGLPFALRLLGASALRGLRARPPRNASPP